MSARDELRGKVFRAITGRDDLDVSGRVDGSLLGMLRAVGGLSERTKSGIDLTAAASKLGVGRRTVERWVQAAETGQGQHPSAKNATRLAEASRQVASTKTGRKAARPNTSANKLTRGSVVRFVGWQGPVSGGEEYMRHRSTALSLDPAETQAMLDAWEARGEKGFMDWATDRWDQEYVEGWSFQGIDDIHIDPPEKGRR